MAIDNVELEFEHEAIDAIADMAIRQKQVLGGSGPLSKNDDRYNVRTAPQEGDKKDYLKDTVEKQISPKLYKAKSA